MDADYLEWLKANRQYVIKKLTELNYNINKDLILIYKEKYYIIDVRRNMGRRRTSRNFVFYLYNKNGERFKFRNNGYFAFIDDLTGNILIVRQEKIAKMICNYDLISSKFNLKCKYVNIPKRDIIADRVINASFDDRQFLYNNQ